MTIRDDRSDEKQTKTGFRGPLMVQSLTSAKSKFLSLLLFSLLLSVFFIGGCSKQDAIIEVHNQLVSIESSMIDQYNGATLMAEQAEAVASGVRRMKRIEIKNCPQDYQNAWDDVIDLWTKWERALRSEDFASADNLGSQSPTLVHKLNLIAKSHGVTFD